MALPGHTVTIGERVAAGVAAPSTANGFMVGVAERGSVTEPILCTSLTDAEAKIGGRVATYPYLWDALDVAFREGASAVYVGRADPEGNKTSAETLVDSESKKVLDVEANSPGEWGDELKVKVAASGEVFTLTVELEEVVVETSPELGTLQEAVEWAQTASSYITLALNGESAKNPKTQSVELKGGEDDFEAKTADVEAALELFAHDLGPGQVASPGITTEAVREAVLAHARDNNRRALLDDEDTSEASTLSANAVALRSVEGNAARYGTCLAPWAKVPGLSANTYRTVPCSAVQMGLIARAESEGATPNQAAAGKRGRARYATDLTQSFTDEDLETLNDGAVTAARVISGVVTTYGDRTIVNPTTEPNWASFAASRLVMGVAALADEVLSDYDFEQIDGRRLVFKKLEGDLAGRACMPYYLANSLYGQTPEEAFSVNTCPDVNTETTIAANEIKAQIAIRVSPLGEVLTVEIVKVPTTESV
jgi:hypothetical protein